MPMPVSVTSKRTSAAPPCAATQLDATVTDARGGELDRVGDQVEEDLAQAPAVAAHARGHRGVDPSVELEALGVRLQLAPTAQTCSTRRAGRSR